MRNNINRSRGTRCKGKECRTGRAVLHGVTGEHRDRRGAWIWVRSSGRHVPLPYDYPAARGEHGGSRDTVEGIPQFLPEEVRTDNHHDDDDGPMIYIVGVT